ncbi:purine nucleoside phosphorylase YfiH [Lonsdalea populi]|uniref:purine nucleoside phosphorylase YfiH n=1 Tax=Lonsdalea populi TaxID=1172565 RepID=UPI000A1FE9DF|nr:purine nucleoside phosphorylase YfiH [Lonsdalea populi]OSM96947.1 hypothetical protein AU499_14060 [Lonsdalea populi]QPQ23558.1 polyphenol oxidase [Lonsdalea populi]RAT40941.1 hypothetical protein AU495_15525 [Lonsdalea populi]RAT41201.1 hypothetical protein AU494_13435 [Lonsdalea populi]RAT57934.1 hypothetical protein AU500_03980 [Lonsdalea populi]
MLIQPDWPAPATICACSTTRHGGSSSEPYASLNLGNHVGDDIACVEENRRRLMVNAELPAQPHWMQQVHGIQVINLDDEFPATTGDAVYTSRPGNVCAVMTADCLPVLFCSVKGDEVAAAHAGWRGLQTGVLEQTLKAFRAAPSEMMAWLGPAIGPQQFEVGAEVRAAFMATDPAAAHAFVARGDKYLADIFQLARRRLSTAGISHIYGGEYCTVSHPQQFFSYRRDGVTGRMASLIWLI